MRSYIIKGLLEGARMSFFPEMRLREEDRSVLERRLFMRWEGDGSVRLLDCIEDARMELECLQRRIGRFERHGFA